MDRAYCDLRATKAYIGLGIRRTVFSPISNFLYALLLFPLALIAFQREPLPLIFGVITLLWILLVARSFLREKLEDDSAPPLSKNNLGGSLSADLVRAVKGNRRMTLAALMEAIFKTPRGTTVALEIGINPEEILGKYGETLREEVDLGELIGKGRVLLPHVHEAKVHPGVLLYVLSHEYPALKPVLDEQNISIEDLERIILLESFHTHLASQQSGLFNSLNLIGKLGAVGRSWIMGYNDELESFTEEIGHRLYWRKERGATIHEESIKAVLHILSQNEQHHALIIGKEGVGKVALVENVAERIRMYEVEKGLPYTEILLVNTELLLSGSPRPDQTLLKALSRAGRSERFLFIFKKFAMFMEASDPHLLAAFSKVLGLGHIDVVAIASPEEYHGVIKEHPGIDAAFEKVFLEDATEGETLLVLTEHAFKLGKQTKMAIPFRSIKTALELSFRYMGAEGLPGKAIRILDDALLSARERRSRVVDEQDIRNVVSLKTHINVQEMGEGERTRLQELESVLRKQIIGQEKATDSMLHALKRARLDIGGGKKPYGTYLFLGPTGVGKTHTAKVIAKHMFGEEGFVRLDMNEFSTEESIRSIVGAKSGEGGFLLQRVQDRPASLILLDEIEKAHPKVLHLFLQVLDEGFLVDWKGVKTDFRNTIIIATSNAGALFIHDYVRNKGDEEIAQKQESFHEKLIESILHERNFSPEFINRFDEVILFHPLREKDMESIATLMFTEFRNDFQKKHGIEIQVSGDVLPAIAKRGYSPEFGAREMRRTLTETLENYLADYLLRNKVKRGETIRIAKEDLRLL